VSHRGESVPEGLEDGILEGSDPTALKSSPPKTQKKRGRKKNTENGDTTHGQPAMQGTADDSFEEPKKKRGRPRKSDRSKGTEIPHEGGLKGGESVIPPTTEAEQGNEGNVGDSVEETTKMTRTREEQKKASPLRTNITSHSPTDDGALKEMSNNAVALDKPTNAGAGRKAPENRETPRTHEPVVTKENAAADQDSRKEAPKDLPKPKVPLRVGLSKRSRIAPLLKSIRK